LKVGGAQLEHSFCDDGELEAGVGIIEDDPAEILTDEEVDPDLLSQGDPRVLRDNDLTNDEKYFSRQRATLARVTSSLDAFPNQNLYGSSGSDGTYRCQHHPTHVNTT
jgi:hypothetical protein